MASTTNPRYSDTIIGDKRQPIQDIKRQYTEYIKDGFKDVGVWITCLVAFWMSEQTHDFLNKWYYEILDKTTQDQISFPYIVYKTQIQPYTISSIGDQENKTEYYLKHDHHQ